MARCTYESASVTHMIMTLGWGWTTLGQSWVGLGLPALVVHFNHCETADESETSNILLYSN